MENIQGIFKDKARDKKELCKFVILLVVLGTKFPEFLLLQLFFISPELGEHYETPLGFSKLIAYLHVVLYLSFINGRHLY